MNPKKINEKENAFLDSLCRRTNETFILEREYELENGAHVYSIRPHHASYFYPEKKSDPKKSICLHFEALHSDQLVSHVYSPFSFFSSAHSQASVVRMQCSSCAAA